MSLAVVSAFVDSLRAILWTHPLDDPLVDADAPRTRTAGAVAAIRTWKNEFR